MEMQDCKISYTTEAIQEGIRQAFIDLYEQKTGFRNALFEAIELGAKEAIQKKKG